MLSANATSVHQRRRENQAPEFRIIQRIKSALADTSLSMTERVVLAHLMLSAGERGETTWRHGTIADRLGVSERTVRRCIAKLGDEGKLETEQRGWHRANRYRMPWHSCGADNSDRTPMATSKDQHVLPEKSDDVAQALNIISTECSELDARKITPADRAAVAEFVDLHGPPTQAQVRAGIAASLVRAQGKRINAIRYFFSEILKARALPNATEYAEHCVRRLRRERELRGTRRSTASGAS